MFRKREGEAPCPVPIVCIGWPFPQFGVPHNTHSSASQIASHEFQNSVVIRCSWILQHPPFFPPLTSQPISVKTEMIPPVVNRPRPIRIHENRVIGIRDQIVHFPCARQQTDVGHANNRQPVPALCPHRTRRALQSHQVRRLSDSTNIREFSALDDVGTLRRHALVIVRKTSQSRPVLDPCIRHDVDNVRAVTQRVSAYPA